MHAEDRYNVTTSLFMLKETKRRTDQVSRGYQLLKRKSDALRIKGRAVAVELASVQDMLNEKLREAYILLAAIKFTNGESNALVLENIGQAQVRVERINENISGVNTVSLEVIEVQSGGDALQYAGLAAGGHRTTEAKKAFRVAIGLLVKASSLRNSCLILDEAIKSTLRKLNGIEKVILPKLKNTESYIMMEMDEREREEVHRIKIMKAKKRRTQFLAANSRQIKTVQDDDELDTDGIITHVRTLVHDKCQTGKCQSHMRSINSLTSTFSRLPLMKKRPVIETEPVGDFSHWEDEDLLF